MALDEKYYFFDGESCDLCGVCLSECPVLALSQEEARKEMKRLIDGDEPKYIFENCTGCMTCNLLCPNDCNPYDLILFRLYERYRKEGLSVIAKFMVTPMQTPSNVWTLLLSESERKIFESWGGEGEELEEIVYPGCVMCFPPYLSKTKIFEGLNFVMKNELCCGEPFYRIGVFDAAERAAKKLEDYFKKLKVKKVVFNCLGCYNTITNIYPSRFGVSYGFESLSFLDVIWDRMKRGEIEIKNEVEITATVHDNCHSKFFGSRYYDLTRSILKELGVEMVEMEHNRERALCCGLAAFAIRNDPMDVLNAASKVVKEAEDTNAEFLVVRCGGCFTPLSVSALLSSSDVEVVHIIELVQMAMGEKPERSGKERAEKMVRLMFEELPKSLEGLPERYWVE